jgi:hypothetical protein
MGHVQEEGTGPVLFNKTHGVVRDQMRGVALDVLACHAVVPVPMIVVICGAIQIAHELIKAVMDGILPRFRAQMPFAEQGRSVSSTVRLSTPKGPGRAYQDGL